MTDILPISRFLPLPRYFRKAPLTVQAYEPEEFSASPVDDVQRAIAQVGEFNIWVTKQLAEMPSVLTLALEKRLISTLESHDIGHEILQQTILHFSGHGFPAEVELRQEEGEIDDDRVLAAIAQEIEPAHFCQERAHHVTASPSGQLALKMAGDFSPSKKLTDIWLSSLSILAKEAGKQVHVHPFEAAQEFSKTLYSLLGTIAQQLRYENPSDTLLSRQQRFTAAYQIQLCDAFLIIPDQAADFLSLLFSELSEAIGAGCTLNGDWGELCLSLTQDLYFRLSPPDFVVDPNFVESEEVE
jgi:hypothetical protein